MSLPYNLYGPQTGDIRANPLIVMTATRTDYMMGAQNELAGETQSGWEAVERARPHPLARPDVIRLQSHPHGRRPRRRGTQGRLHNRPRRHAGGSPRPVGRLQRWSAPGLSLPTVPWLYEHGVAAIATDTWGYEVRPNEVPNEVELAVK